MERPRSMIGSVAHSMPSHKRNASSIKSLSKLQAPSTAAERPQTAIRSAAPTLHAKDKETIHLFINNLKLLEMHSSSDWPSLTTSSFSSHDSKTRTRCSEWSLYQLFRTYDQQTTADKLQPFFPPLEPLQSVNLRAALYRCLNELKKNGVLGREITLRKTMLDECSGEKFWELCLAFSGAVLRKVTLQRGGRYGQPVAQRLAIAQVLNKREKESLLPLVVAHKSALSRVVSQNQRRRESYIHVFDSMKDKEEELINRKNFVETQPPIVESAEHAEELDMIEREIKSNWTNDESFKDAIINGDPAKPGDHMLLQSTDKFLERIGRDDHHDIRRDSGVLEDIDLQARAQNARVKEWQTLYVRLQKDKRSSTSSAASRERKKVVGVQFDQHHDLGIDDIQPEPVKSMTQPEPTPSYVSKYDEILTSMREELRRAQTIRREAEARQAPPVRKPSITLDAVFGAPQLPPSRSASHRSMSPTFPLRPEMVRRASSRTRSYQQPKVISQREPIPLKSEIFSPLKRTGSVSPASGRSSIIGSPIEENPPTAIETMMRSNRESQGSSNTPTIDSGIGLGLDLTDSPIQTDKIAEEVFKRPAIPASRSVSFAQRKSLSERTRMSMLTTHQDDNSAEATSRTHDQDQDSSDDSQGLAARTRQSMAGINVPLPISTSSSLSHTRSSSMAQSIMPAKPRTIVRQTSRSFSVESSLEPVSVNEQARRNITPRERLFDADAEYNSVFRTRPKVANSPPLTPAIVDDAHTMLDDALL